MLQSSQFNENKKSKKEEKQQSSNENLNNSNTNNNSNNSNNNLNLNLNNTTNMLSIYSDFINLKQTSEKITLENKLLEKEQEEGMPIYIKILEIHEGKQPIEREIEFGKRQLKMLKNFSKLPIEEKTKEKLQQVNKEMMKQAREDFIEMYKVYLESRDYSLSRDNKRTKRKKEDNLKMQNMYLSSLDEWLEKKDIFKYFPNISDNKFEQLSVIIPNLKKIHKDIFELFSKLFDKQTELTQKFQETEQHYQKPLIEELKMRFKKIEDSLTDKCLSCDTNQVIEFVKSKKLNSQKTKELINQFCNGFTPLHIACAKGNYALVEWLLKNGANTEVFDKEYGFHTLHYAASSGNSEIIKLIHRYRKTQLKEKALIDVIDNRPENNRLEKCYLEIKIIDTTLEKETIEKWKKDENIWHILLLIIKTEPTQTNEKEKAKIVFFERGRTDEFKVIEIDSSFPDQKSLQNIKESLQNIKKGFLDAFFSPSITKLKVDKPYKFEQKNKEIFDFVNSVINSYNIDSYHRTPLSTAILYGKQDTAIWLIYKGANFNKIEKCYGNSILHIASMYYPKMLYFLLEREGINTAIKNNIDERAILTAALYSPKAYEIFLNYGFTLDEHEQNILNKHNKKIEKEKKIEISEKPEKQPNNNNNSISPISSTLFTSDFTQLTNEQLNRNIELSKQEIIEKENSKNNSQKEIQNEEQKKQFCIEGENANEKIKTPPTTISALNMFTSNNSNSNSSNNVQPPIQQPPIQQS